ncbi:helix-turn-helix and ligand-binding sensor domain-containing protein [Saccharicrinis aurantiacus]|uniref:helix-turn-helix and ligand-binding sensor domain-containing protein n=1 Tax=Saccharicrinis aurantiacus TaxID=1849719 RepID=UPI00248F8DF4|nr:triple tyrosine motif-containing protein [Saccharicrinis aurantiacus]
MNCNLFKYIIVLIVMHIGVASYAQIKKIGLAEVEVFNRRQYNGATQNWKITQSEYNYIYAANNDGLLEFDGETWRRYINTGNTIVRSTYATQNRIYVGAISELGYYSYNENESLVYHSYSNLGNLNTLGDYWTILEINDQIIFHSQQGLAIIKDDKLLKTIAAPSILISCFKVNNTILVQDEEEGLMELRGFELYPIPGGHRFKGQVIGSMMSLSNSEVLIGTMKEGLFVWDMTTIKPWDSPTNKMLDKANVFCGTVHSNELLVFGTIQSGIIITDKKGKLVMHIDKDKGLKNNTVLGVFVDIEGNIWCGLDNGIARIALNAPVTFISSYFDLGTGYTSSKIGDDWYFGTNQGLFTINNKSLVNPEKTHSDFKKIEGTDGQVWSIYNNGTNPLCGHNLGVFEIDGNRSKLITPSSIRGVWNFKPVPNNPNLLMCGTYSGLILLRWNGTNWVFHKKLNDFDVSSRFIEWDALSNLWVSHGSIGVYKISFNSALDEIDKVELFSTDYFSENSSVVVSSVAGETILSCSDKVFYINQYGKIADYTQLNKYFASKEFPLSYQQDKYGNIWYFFENHTGVLRLLEDGNYIRIENPFTNLKQKLVSSFENVFVADQANAVFGIEDGFAHYSTQDNNNFRLPLYVHMRYFKSENDTMMVALNQKKGQSQQAIPQIDFADNTIEIAYASPYFDDQEVLYQSKLHGVDAHKTEWTRNTTRIFTQLHEGKYQFDVKAKNSYGTVSETLSYKFVIKPPWHRSNTAKIIYLILILLTASLLGFIFNKRVEVSRAREKLKQQERFKRREENLKNEALRNEKELIKMRNDKLRTDVLHKEKELANSTMNIIHKNDFLVSIKESLKQIKKVTDVSQLQQKVNKLIKNIDKDIDSESYWEIFEVHLEHIHEDFLKRLLERHPDLNSKEKKLCAYIRMGMSSKDIASLMNISAPTVDNNRYKLRQKLNIEQGTNLNKYITDM